MNEFGEVMMYLGEGSEYSFEIVALFRMIVASVCGGLIGLERELKGRPAGMKTFSLVCIGATLAMITNDYISKNLSGGGDAARMAAQVISGIGFLGAGTIIVTGTNQVKGLTTAAALWVTAALGISIGAGFYFGGIAGIIVIFSTSLTCKLLDRVVMEKSRMMTIYAEGRDEEFMLELIKYFGDKNIRIINLVRRSENKWYKKDTCVVIELDLGKRQRHSLILEEIRKLKGIRFVETV